MDGAGAAQAHAATELRAFEREFIPAEPRAAALQGHRQIAGSFRLVSA